MSTSYHLDDGATTSHSLGSYTLAIFAVVYVVFKSLELLGFPVWLWLHQALHMAVETAPIKFPFPASILNKLAGSSEAEDDEPQKSDMPGRAGNVLSGVFGLTNGSLLGKGVRGVSGALSGNNRMVPAGLGNWDNSCYQNSVIQGLSSLPSLHEYLSKTTGEYNALDSETTNGALFDMINKLNSPENHGQYFWIRGKLKSMNTFQQQDAQEYYSKILDALDKEVQDASSSKRRSTVSWLLTMKSLSDSSIATPSQEMPETDGQNEEKSNPPEQPQISPNPLDGLLAQRVGCINCGYTEGLTFIPFNCITVSLGRGWAYDVRECLDEYTNLELIQGVECAKCTLLKYEKTLSKLAQVKPEFTPRLQAIQEALEDENFEDKTLIKDLGFLKKNWVQSTKSRQAVIGRAPKSLVLHVNRSIFNEMTGDQLKNTANVMYPKILDLGTWCLGSHPSDSQRPDDLIEETWPRDPTKSLLGDVDTEPTTNSPFQYALKAVVTHFGNHANGHYVCYRQQSLQSSEAAESNDIKETEKCPREQWWRLSDENVYAIPEEDALRQGNVFMLFYERIDEDLSSTRRPEACIETLDEIAAQIPLPDDDDDIAAQAPLPHDDHDDNGNFPPSLPPNAKPSTMSPNIELTEPEKVGEHSVYPTPPPDTPQAVPYEDQEMSETDTANYESEDAPSTQLTSDDDAEIDDEPPKQLSNIYGNSSLRPQRMRTAGDVRGEEERSSLPMVTAT